MELTQSARPLVSIVVNNYNYARFLVTAIDSALAQTYTPLEVIVVDDGSTDDSRAVISRYEDRVRAVLQPNGGQGAAFNNGFRVSSGGIVIFLDADDVLLPTAAERAVGAFGPGVTKVHWPLLEIDAEGVATGNIQPRYPLASGDLRPRCVLEGPLSGDAPPTSGNAWSRELLERILPMPEAELRICSDSYLVMLAWLYGEVRTIEEPLALYRVHGANWFDSQSDEQKLTQYFAMFAHHCETLARHMTALGLAVDPEDWKIKQGLCEHSVRVAAAERELATLVPRDAKTVMAEDGQWHGAAGITALERLHATGADYIVFPWYARASLREDAEIDQYLRGSFPCIDAYHVTVFDLKWAQRVRAAAQQLMELLPRGARYILVDEGSWGEQPIADCHAIPFLERDGIYWGNPADSAEATREFERLRAEGAQFIVFPWVTAWWLEMEDYAAFAAHLRAHFELLHAGPLVTVFDLRSP